MEPKRDDPGNPFPAADCEPQVSQDPATPRPPGHGFRIRLLQSLRKANGKAGTGPGAFTARPKKAGVRTRRVDAVSIPAGRVLEQGVIPPRRPTGNSGGRRGMRRLACQGGHAGPLGRRRLRRGRPFGPCRAFDALGGTMPAMPPWMCSRRAFGRPNDPDSPFFKKTAGFLDVGLSPAGGPLCVEVGGCPLMFKSLRTPGRMRPPERHKGRGKRAAAKGSPGFARAEASAAENAAATFCKAQSSPRPGRKARRAWPAERT